MIKRLSLTALMLAATATVANASLGQFSLTDGTNSLTLVDTNNNFLGKLPNTFAGNGNVLWFPTKTANFPGAGAIPTFTIDINNGGTLYSMEKVTPQYVAATNTLKLLDNTVSPKLQIAINDVMIPGGTITATTPLDDVMPTLGTSFFTFILGGVPQFQIAAVPEPSAFVLGGLVVGMVGVGRFVRKRKTAKK